MSDNIPPFDLQVQIMKWLQVRSLLQFRSVSKAWKSAIDSPRFIARYRGRQHLLVRYWDHELDDYRYDHIVDDDTFPHQRVSITLPQHAKMLENRIIIRSSHGLFCLHNYVPFEDDPITEAVIWNPSIRKVVSVAVPKVAAAVVVPNAVYKTIPGFGVCGETSDPKIVKIAYHTRKLDAFSISCIPWQVEVFRLSTGSWRTLNSSSHLCSKSIRSNEHNMVVVDGVLYWLAMERITKMDGNESRYRMLIISFDVTSEEFGEVNLPDSLATRVKHYGEDYQPIGNLSIYEMRGSLVVLQDDVEANEPFYNVWMMEEEGVPKPFTKLLTFNRNTLDLLDFEVKGFRKTGEFIIEIDTDDGVRGTLALYEPSSKSLHYIAVNKRGKPHNVYSYLESLLLL